MKVKHYKITPTRTVWGTASVEFNIVESILKTHFKELMRLAKRYDKRKKTGLIVDNDLDQFLALAKKIEASNPKRCSTSHKKSIEKSKQRRLRKSCEHEDLGSLGYRHGDIVKCPYCGKMAEVW